MSSPQKSNEFLTRPVRLIIIWGSILLFAFFVWSAYEARKKSSDRVVDWLPQGTKELTVFLERYWRHFSEGEYLMVSWKDCTIHDTRLDAIAATLTASPGNDRPPYFYRAMTTRSAIEDLISNITQPRRLTQEGAKARLAGWLIGKDGEAACLVLVPNPDGWQNPTEAVEFLFTSIESITGLTRCDIYVAGTSIDSVAISETSRRSQQTLLPIFLLFSVFLLFCCLRHYFAALLVFWVAMINEELAGTLLFWCGAHVDSISMLNSSLVYVLTISGSVHLINYYRRTLAEMQPGDDERNVPMQTFRKAILPCSLAAFTTILGIGSLAVSQMVPIRTFGIFASLTLFLGTIWFFLCILSVLQERPIRKWFPCFCRYMYPCGCGRPPNSDPIRGLTDPNKIVWRLVWLGLSNLKDNFWILFGLLVFRWRYPITVLTFLMLVIFSFGIKDLKTSVTFHGLLPKEAKILQDYRTLENKIGGLIPIEVVVHFPEDEWKDRRMLEQLHFLASVVDELWEMEDACAIVSVLNFLPSLPSLTDGGRAVSERSVMEGVLNRNQERLRELRFFNSVEDDSDDAGNYWRISLRLSTQKAPHFATIIEEVSERLERIHDGVAVRFDVTGGVPLVQQAQHMLLQDLIHSFMMAFALIALTMIIILRGVVRGLLAMIPNVFPCVIVFGMLGLLGVPVNMGSMMTASVALGISVDGTLHLLTWVNIALRRGMSRKDAVLYALGQCSTALTQTMVICGVGMLVFAWSDFVPVAQFSMLLCTILLISLVGAIVALPAILFSPLGRFFEGSDKDKGKTWIL